MTETAIICAVFGIFILFAFIKGVQIGVKLRNNEPIKVSNPVKTIKEKKQEKIERKIQNRQQTIMEMNLANIEAYDGTELGQKDIPR